MCLCVYVYIEREREERKILPQTWLNIWLRSNALRWTVPTASHIVYLLECLCSGHGVTYLVIMATLSLALENPIHTKVRCLRPNGFHRMGTHFKYLWPRLFCLLVSCHTSPGQPCSCREEVVNHPGYQTAAKIVCFWYWVRNLGLENKSKLIGDFSLQWIHSAYLLCNIPLQC